jgi:hypothetical protein
MIQIQNDGDTLYTSNKDLDGEQNVEKVFVPADPVEYAIRTAPKATTVLFSPQSILPQKTIIRPEIVEPTNPETVRINSEKLYNAYGSGSEQIIKDIQNKIPLDPDIAEHLVTSNIITESKEIKKKVTIPLQSIPTKTVTSKSIKAYSTSLVNNLTNFIYKLIYGKNG